ncbi:MAG: hypothetical protein U1D55_09290 [Phycisphaerae bacterium]
MKTVRARVLTLIGGALIAAASGGCLFAADALNPNVLTSFGISPQTVSSGGGRVIVVFDNQASLEASMSAVEVDDATTPTQARESNRTLIPAGESANVVLDCPVAAVIPGRIGDQGTTIQIDDVTAVVDPNGAATEVSYTGAPLRASVDYRCGDVIVISLLQAAGTTDQFRISVRVIPGR